MKYKSITLMRDIVDEMRMMEQFRQIVSAYHTHTDTIWTLSVNNMSRSSVCAVVLSATGFDASSGLTRTGYSCEPAKVNAIGEEEESKSDKQGTRVRVVLILLIVLTKEDLEKERDTSKQAERERGAGNIERTAHTVPLPPPLTLLCSSRNFARLGTQIQFPGSIPRKHTRFVLQW